MMQTLPIARLRLLCLVWLALPALWLLGCTQNLERNPTFQEHAAKVETLSEDLKAATRRVQSLDSQIQKMDAEFQSVSKLVAKVSAAGPGSPDVAKALEQRILNLENSLKTANQQIAAIDSRGKTPVAMAAAVKPAAASPAGPASEAAPATPAKVATAKMVKARPAATSEPRAIARSSGRYYLVRQNETLEMIAATQRVAKDAILIANRLPSNAGILPGQQLYIPAR